MSAIDPKFYEKGLRFECTGCGDCCRARHGYSFIYVTPTERRALAEHLGISQRTFERKHCQTTDGWVHLREPSNDCHFLEGTRCKVYEARPQQCRTWPFWPENMSAKVWEKEVKRDCEGVGVGRFYSKAEIEKILATQKEE